MSGSAQGVVAFNYATFSALFPEFTATVNEVQAQAAFNRATLQLDNTSGGIIQDASPGGLRETLLYLLAAHLLTLGQRDANQVGRIDSAGQGSVNVSLEGAPISGTSAWYMQTKYGFEYWNATAPYRLFQPVPVCQPFFIPYQNL